MTEPVVKPMVKPKEPITEPKRIEPKRIEPKRRQKPFLPEVTPDVQPDPKA